MEIEKVKEMKRKLDSDINNLIKKFEEQTDMRISGVNCIDISTKVDLNRPNIIIETVLSWK